MKTFNYYTTDKNEILKIVDDALSHKYLYSNFFGIDYSNTEIKVTTNSYFLKKKFDGYSRLYLLSNSNEEVISELKKQEANCVINIPSRKGIEEWKEILEPSGFRQLAIYKRMVYRKYPIRKIKNVCYANNSDMSIIYNEIFSRFSPLTGHLPNTIELTDLIANNNIVVNRDSEGKVTGALCYQIDGTKCYLSFWYDIDGRGLTLLNTVFGICHEKEVKNISFWVNEDNIQVIKMHSLFGAIEDGLIDYVYSK